MAETAAETAQPTSGPSSTIQPWSNIVHEMAMSAIIQKHSNFSTVSVSPAGTPTTKTALKSLCLPSISATSGQNVIQPNYITVNSLPSQPSAGSLPLLAQGVPGTAQVIQGTPIAMSQLQDIGHASVVQLTPIAYASDGTVLQGQA